MHVGSTKLIENYYVQEMIKIVTVKIMVNHNKKKLPNSCRIWLCKCDFNYLTKNFKIKQVLSCKINTNFFFLKFSYLLFTFLRLITSASSLLGLIFSYMKGAWNMDQELNHDVLEKTFATGFIEIRCCWWLMTPFI